MRGGCFIPRKEEANVNAYSKGLAIPAALFLAAMFNPIAGISSPTPAFADEVASQNTQHVGEADLSNSPDSEDDNENIAQDGQASAENQNANPANEGGNGTGDENNTAAGQEEDESSNVSSNENISEEHTTTDSAQHFLSSQSKKSTLSKTTTASKANKVGNFDQFIGLGKSIKVIATSNTKYSKCYRIYKKDSKKSKKLYKLTGQTCVVCYTSKLTKGKDYSYIPVLLPNTEHGMGYICRTSFLFDTIDTSTFGMSASVKNRNKRINVCNRALSLLGTHYTPAKGQTDTQTTFNCWQFVVNCYNSADISKVASKKLTPKSVKSVYNLAKYGKSIKKKKLKPGDLVFYPGRDGSTNGHVGIYLGNGFVIHSTCDKGREYPRGGVHITKLTFRASPQQYRTLF